MRNVFTGAVCSTHTGDVSMNISGSGKSGAIDFCSIKIPVNSPPSTCSHGSTVHASLVCSSSLFNFLDISNSMGVSFIYWPAYEPLQHRELEIRQVFFFFFFTVACLWLTVIFPIWPPFGLQAQLQPGTGRIQVGILAGNPGSTTWMSGSSTMSNGDILRTFFCVSGKNRISGVWRIWNDCQRNVKQLKTRVGIKP